MNRILTIVTVIALCTGSLHAQNVSINETGDPANPKAMLDVQSETKGLLIPRMSTADRVAIAPTAAEMGIMVYDTTEKAFFFHDGIDWKQLSSLWLKDANGINRPSNIGVNAASTGNYGINVPMPSGVGGPDSSAIYAYRQGYPGGSNIGGTGFEYDKVSAAILSYSDWGNPYSAAVAGYGVLDYGYSAAVLGSTQDGRIKGILAYRDPELGLFAGYMDGLTWMTDRVGIRTAPNTTFTLNVQSALERYTGYFYNSHINEQTTFGVYGGAFGTGTGDKRGGSFDAFGGEGTNIGVRGTATGAPTNIGVYGTASGGQTNWAGHFDNGNVIIDDRLGIGTTNPNYKLHATTSDVSITGYFLNTRNSTIPSYGLYAQALNAGTGIAIGVLSTSSGVENYAFYGVGNTYVSEDLRIGTTANPGAYRLIVNGNAIVEELRIQDSGDWPDYVFQSDYHLMSLDELQLSIKRNGHLPGVPSASSIESDGIVVGDMQKRMMEKIEELTLYVLQINTRVSDLEAENSALRQALEDQKR